MDKQLIKKMIKAGADARKRIKIYSDGMNKKRKNLILLKRLMNNTKRNGMEAVGYKYTIDI